MSTVTAIALVGGLAACGGSTDERNQPTEGTPAPTTAAMTSSAQAATPEPTEDQWLEQVEPEREAVLSWWSEFEAADCQAAAPECYDQFAEGQQLLQDLHEGLDPIVMESPDYVDMFVLGEVFTAGRTMESWSYACPDASDCTTMAANAEERVLGVVEELRAWGE